METGRVIHRRYLLQRLLKQGQFCAIYQGTDQVLQRPVVVKISPAAHIPAYRAAIRQTSQFSHPNIVGIYDLIIEAETLYVIQEYIDGDDFGTLLQTQLQPHQVADLGAQVCQALLYAGSASRRVCHGDLTPSSIIRDHQGLVRVNNFALPSDLYYFTGWSVVGGDGNPLSDRELPWGQQTEGRRADDTRAVGLLLYQLLSGRNPGAKSVEPPADGRLRFLRNVPAELCEVIARTVIRQHPQNLNTPEALYTELKTLAEVLEPPTPVTTAGIYKTENAAQPQQFTPAGTGKLVTALPVREPGTGGAFSSGNTAQQRTVLEAPAAQTVADVSLKLATARQAAYPETPRATPQKKINFPLLFLLCLVVFAFCTAIGYFLAINVFHP